MHSEFQIGQKSLDTFKTIIENQEKISFVTLIPHKVDLNWREIYKTPQKKIKFLFDYFNSEDYKNPNEKTYIQEEFLKLEITDLPGLEENHVWSIKSKVLCTDGKNRHIPMMNLHPHENLSQKEIIKALKYICDYDGALLDSGRFLHVCYNYLLDEYDWRQEFMPKFLIPDVLVSPTYIGIRLVNDYCNLRITSDGKYKQKIPEVIKVF